MISAGITDRGKMRKINQDEKGIFENKDALLTIVCDGIGGNKAGEIASKMAVETMKRQFETAEEYNETWFKKAVENVNTVVYQASLINEDFKGMGTTLVASLICADGVYVANVGDSRAYYLTKDKQLKQISVDHTIINELVLVKNIPYEIASAMVGKNVINRAIGVMSSVKVDVFELQDEYDGLLLCSDGLHGYVSLEEISEIVFNDSNIEEKCHQLIDLANDKSGADNITAVLTLR